MLWFEVVDLGKLEAGLLEVGHLMSVVWRAYLAFFGWSWVGVGAKVKDASRYWASPDHFWPAAAGIVVRLPKLVGKSELCQVVSQLKVVSQSSVFIYGLASVHLYIQSLNFKTSRGKHRRKCIPWVQQTFLKADTKCTIHKRKKLIYWTLRTFL